VPGAVRAFAPDVLVTQCGCDTHHEDPLANLELTVDGQRTAIAELHALAHRVAGGKWVAFGGGGYGLVRCVPRTWTHLLAAAAGGTFHLRPIRPTDADAIVRFHAGLSQRTRYLRYFSAYPRIPERDLIRFTNVDHHDRVALVAELAGEIIAVGRYERHPDSDEAEVAFVVADDHQGRGIGSVLLEHLAAAARECGLHRFVAIVLAENV